MNPTTEQVALQPSRSSFSCDRHPDEQFTGFCPSCLYERLASLEQSNSSRYPTCSSSSSNLKAIFRVPSIKQPKPAHAASSTSLNPELRRTQSFSASKNEGFSGVLFEPQRHSCDVRARSTLWSLFNLNDENDHRKSTASLIDQQPPQIEEVEEDIRENFPNEDSDSGDEIRSCKDETIQTCVPSFTQEGDIIFQEEQHRQAEEEFKTMKHHIDLDSHAKKRFSSSGMDLKEIAGNFWSAASVFSKKWQKWRQKQKLKKQRSRGGSTLPVEKPIYRQYRETQSEIADYGFGRHSCDTDPTRFSLDIPRISFDAARMSFDDVRPSFDEPRASWDGYLIGGGSGIRSFPRLPPILSVVEASPAAVHVTRTDMKIPVMEEGEGENVPGGSVQTREYYSSSSSRRKKSLDRSNSIRKAAAAVVAEINDKKVILKAKETPAAVERVSVDSNSNSVQDDCSETFEFGFKDNGMVNGTAERKGTSKKSRRWKDIWALIIRRAGGTKDEDEEERYSKENGIERSLSESWKEFRGERNGEGSLSYNGGVFRSNSSLNWRNLNSNGASLGGVMKMGSKSNARKKRDDFVLERNRSARYSPNHIDNGLLRLYSAPLRSSCRRGGGGGLGNSRGNSSLSMARTILRLY